MRGRGRGGLSYGPRHGGSAGPSRDVGAGAGVAGASSRGASTSARSSARAGTGRAPVLPEDGTALGIRNMKRVADFGPPTVGTVPPPRGKRPRRGNPGRAGGAYGGSLHNNNGLPPRVGAVQNPPGWKRGGAPPQLSNSRPSSSVSRLPPRPENDTDKDDKDKDKDSTKREKKKKKKVRQREEKSQNEGLAAESRRQSQDDRPPAPALTPAPARAPVAHPLPPRPPSPICLLSSSTQNQYSPSLPAVRLSDSHMDVDDVGSRAGAGSSTAQAGPSAPQAGPSTGSAASTLAPTWRTHSPAPPAPAPAEEPRRPKFKPRNHNVRENDPVPPPPAREPSPPPPPPPPPVPEPPKFKPRNPNPRKNDPVPPAPPVPAPVSAAPAPRPPQPSSTSQPLAPPPALKPPAPALTHHPIPAPPRPPTPPRPIPGPSASASASAEPQDIKPDSKSLDPPRESPDPPPRSPQKEGVDWIKPHEIPFECQEKGTAARRSRAVARQAYMATHRTRLHKEGKVLVSSKWRPDGLAIDWRLKNHTPLPEDDSDDDIIEVIPAPRKPTPEAIVLVDSPSPPPSRPDPPAPPAAAPAATVPVATTTAAAPSTLVASPALGPASELAVFLSSLTPPVASCPALPALPAAPPSRDRLSPVPPPAALPEYTGRITRSRSRSMSPNIAILSELADLAPATVGTAATTAAPAAPAVDQSLSLAELLAPQLPAGAPPLPPVDASSLGLTQPGPLLGSLSSNWLGPASVPASAPTMGASNAMQWIDTAAIERAVAEATSAARSSRTPSVPPPGTAASLGPGPSSLGLFSQPLYTLHTAGSAPLHTPSPPVAADVHGVLAPSADAGTVLLPPQTPAERLAALQTQLNGLFDRIDRWMRLQEDFPARAEQLQRHIERTELSIFDVQNQMDVEKRKIEEEQGEGVSESKAE